MSNIQSFLRWYKQEATVLGLSRPVTHARENKGYILRQAALFVPTVLAGAVHTISGGGKILKENEVTAKRTFEYHLTLVAIIKNERPYLREWVAYHHLRGVDRFVIYDNESEDCPEEVLQPFIESGLVEYVKWPGKAQQVIAYSDAITRYRERTKYLGFIDLDEFVYVEGDASLPQYMDRHFGKYPQSCGIAIPWYNFGTSHHKTKPEGLVIENYTLRAAFGFIPNVKTIGNPRLMHSCLNPHIPLWKHGGSNFDEFGRRSRCTRLMQVLEPQTIFINHYYTKSEEEYWAKIRRGMADGYGMRPQDMEAFNARNRNEVRDERMLKYAAAVWRM